MTERQEQMIYDEGRRRGFNDGYEACRNELAEKMMERIEDDGTLVIGVKDATAVTRVLVEDGQKNGDLYYADRPKGEWIPCEERLPEDSGDYLVRPSDRVLEDYSDFSEVMIMPYDADCEAFGWWTERYDPISLGYVDSDFNEFDVLAWMPLPKPWKGADDE